MLSRMNTNRSAFRSIERSFLDGPEFRAFVCIACGEEVESVDSHTTCADCAAKRDAADERQERADRAGFSAEDAAELNAWCDALRAEAIDAMEAECTEERPHRIAA